LSTERFVLTPPEDGEHYPVIVSNVVSTGKRDGEGGLPAHSLH